MPRDTIPPPIVVRDSREQSPLCPYVLRVRDGVACKDMLATRDAGLEAGDYAPLGLEHLMFIERKSLPDLWGSLFGSGPDTSCGERTHRIDRLRAEFALAEDRPRKVLLVEADQGSFEEPHPAPGLATRTLVAYARQRYLESGKRGRSPEQNVAAVLGMLASFWVDYGVATMWAGSRRGAELWLGTTMVRIHEQAHGGPKAKVARERGLRLPWMQEAIDDRNRHEVRPEGSVERDGGIPPFSGDVGEGPAVVGASQVVRLHTEAEEHLRGAGLPGAGGALRGNADPPVAVAS